VNPKTLDFSPFSEFLAGTGAEVLRIVDAETTTITTQGEIIYVYRVSRSGMLSGLSDPRPAIDAVRTKLISAVEMLSHISRR
jgi:hypothetical protein